MGTNCHKLAIINSTVSPP